MTVIWTSYLTAINNSPVDERDSPLIEQHDLLEVRPNFGHTSIMDDQRLLTLAQVLSVAADNGRPVTPSTFRTYVAKKLAPQPTRRQSRTPLWDRADIEAWLQDDLDRASFAHAVQALGIPEESTAVQGISLRTSHLVRLDPALPFPDALVEAEGDLESRIVDLQDLVGRLEAVVTTASMHESLPSTSRQGLVAGLLQRREAARTYRQQTQQAAEVAAELEATTIALREAQEDLEQVRESIMNLLAWAEKEKKRRVARMLNEEVEREREERRLDESRGTRYESAIAFIGEDDRRLSWVAGPSGQRDEPSKAEVLKAISGEPSDFDPFDIFLVLSGADFGYRWRHDDTYAKRSSSLDRQGEWRLSWIPESGELYAQYRPALRGWTAPSSRSINSAPVWLIGCTPVTSLRAMTEWLEPIERRQSERNSLSIVFDAFDEQESAGFPALRDRTDRGFFGI
jgi:predicted DNA-binding transcriptional regulator AlpA